MQEMKLIMIMFLINNQNIKKMEQIFKVGDELFLGTEKVKLIDIGYSKSRPFFIKSDSELSFWFPKSIEKLLSFTPYHFEGDYLVGFTQVRPWQPKKNEVVWGWDENDKCKYIGIYEGFKSGLHQLKTAKSIKDEISRTVETFKFVEPFEIDFKQKENQGNHEEINFFDKNGNISTRPTIGLVPILAEITKQANLGKENWHEVVYFDDGWRSYAGSDTFKNGEQVVKWKYIKDCF